MRKQVFVLNLMAFVALSSAAVASPPSQSPASTTAVKAKTSKTEMSLRSVKQIAVVGDSLSDGYGVSREKAYPVLLEKKLQAAGYKIKVTNASISGSTSASATRRAEWVLRSKPDMVIIALGANDGLRGLDPKETKKNIVSAVKAASNQGVPAVIAGMKMPPNYGKEYTRSFEAVFQDAAKETGAPLLPFLLEGVGGEKEFNQADGIHPNEKGHEKIATLVFNFLKEKYQ